MIVKNIQVGQIGTNCYLFGDENAKVCAVVDPGDEPRRIAKMVLDSGMELRYIFVTHGHFDHCLGVPGLLEIYPQAQVYIHPEEVDHSGAAMNYMKLPALPGLNYYNEGDSLTLGSLTIQVMNTPGHSKGSVSLLVGDHLFAGDTLFRGSCGRTDFAGGSFREMQQSLKRLSQLPGNPAVYPGHEGTTTLDAERARNPYVREALSALP